MLFGLNFWLLATPVAMQELPTFSGSAQLPSKHSLEKEAVAKSIVRTAGAGIGVM